MSLQLSPAEIEQFAKALLSAYPSKGNLEQLVFFRLGEHLNQVTKEGTYRDIVKDLVVWANSEDQADKLLTQARDMNPGNPQLRQFEEKVRRDHNPTPDIVSFPTPLIGYGVHEQEITKDSSAEDVNRRRIIMLTPSELKMPKTGEIFLDPAERKRIIAIVTTIIEEKSAAAKRTLLINSRIPIGSINNINFNQGTLNVATDIVTMLEKMGSLSSPEYHALGSFLAEVTTEEVGYDAGSELVAIIFRHSLIKNRERISLLSGHFQVPSPEGILHSQLILSPLPEWLHLPDQRERLESLYNGGNRHYVDANFLRKGAKLVRSVCRVEFRGTAEGTGFLVAPNLVLTNYHVVMPFKYPGSIEERAKICGMRFGAIRDSEDEVELFKLDKDWCVAYSKSQDLDYALLRLERSASEGGLISPISLTQRTKPVQEKEFVNIIHHPRGGYLEVSLRCNEVVAIRDRHIYYLADTEDGSSGSPVFDDNWQVVALHRSGGEKDEEGNLLARANAGIPYRVLCKRSLCQMTQSALVLGSEEFGNEPLHKIRYGANAGVPIELVFKKIEDLLK